MKNRYMWEICQLFEGDTAYDGHGFLKTEAVTRPDGLNYDYPDARGQYLTVPA